MAKKTASKPSKPSKTAAKGPSSEDHRARAAEFRARARLHEAKAEMMDVKDPKKKTSFPHY